MTDKITGDTIEAVPFLEEIRRKNRRIEKRICWIITIIGIVIFIIDLSLNPAHGILAMASAMIGAVIGIGLVGVLKHDK